MTSSGGQANGRSLTPVIGDGAHRVVFVSSSTNLAPRDRDDDWDVFVRDRDAGTTRLVSLHGKSDIDGIMPAASYDARHVAFWAATQVVVPSDSSDIWVRDLDRNRTRLASRNTAGVRGNSYSSWPAMSADGRYVAYMSFATNLVRGDSNHRSDVFRHDRSTGATTRVSLTTRGRQANGWSGDPSMSADGRYVAFLSRATNLVRGDTNGFVDVFVRDTTR